ncbi:MAG TPA: NmrA family NAD(P)-binding protein, partial [Kofleriaceae bacterium]
DRSVIDRAFSGADTVFWLAPPNPRAATLAEGYTEFAAPAVAALREHGIERVVGISALGRGRSANAGYVTASLAMDDQIAATGVAFRALAMPSFMDNLLRQVDGLKQRGMFVGTIRPDRKLPTVATRDIAAVATTFLSDRSWTGVAEVPVLGPEDLSHDDMAQIMSDVLGKPIRYQQVSLEASKAQMLERGMSEAMAQGRIDMMAAKDAGLDNGAERSPDIATPTTFRQWCEDVLVPAVNGR